MAPFMAVFRDSMSHCSSAGPEITEARNSGASVDVPAGLPELFYPDPMTCTRLHTKSPAPPQRGPLSSDKKAVKTPPL